MIFWISSVPWGQTLVKIELYTKFEIFYINTDINYSKAKCISQLSTKNWINSENFSLISSMVLKIFDFKVRVSFNLTATRENPQIFKISYLGQFLRYRGEIFKNFSTLCLLKAYQILWKSEVVWWTPLVELMWNDPLETFSPSHYCTCNNYSPKIFVKP